MNPVINNDANEEIKIKKKEDLLNANVVIVKIDLNAEIPDLDVKSRKIRLVLNKVTEDNFERLGLELVTGFQYNFKLLAELVRLIFDRAVVRNFAGLFSNTCAYFYAQMKQQNKEVSRAFKQGINQKCEAQLSQNSESLVPLSKFIGLLYKEKLVKCMVVFQFFEVSMKQTSSDCQLEAAFYLLRLLSPHLAYSNLERLEKVFTDLSSLSTERLSKKIQFLILDLVENKTTLTSPTPLRQKSSENAMSHTKKTGKIVSFGSVSEFQQVQCGNSKRILKQNVSEETKTILREAVGEHVIGKKNLEVIKEIFKNNKNKERQLVNQTFKYALIHYDREQEFLKVCDLVVQVTEAIGKKEVIETGIMYTVEAIQDIKLDSPMASEHLTFIIDHLESTGVIADAKYLTKNLSNN